MILGGEKPPLKELTHFGVLGMKWGHRKTATGSEIKDARRRLKSESHSYGVQSRKLDQMAEGSVKRAEFEKQLRQRHQQYLKNPDRVIAARMTRGEKFVALAAGAGDGVGLGVALGTIATRSAISRRIEFKQEKGAYNKASKGPVRKRIGFQTGGQVLTAVGAAAAPVLIRSLGTTAVSSIAAKAAANRAAGKAASSKALGSAASKLKYVKPNRAGVHVITSLK